jgi:hypothetical protein
MASIDVIQRLYELLGEKTVLLPLQAGTKKCLQKFWQKTKLEDTKVDAYVSKLVTGNIGVSLGSPSSGLVSMDFDDDDVAAEFLDKNPALQTTFRTRGARGCNVWVRIDGNYPNACKIMSRLENKPVGEWRATGNYTAVWGKHPSGCDYTWIVDAAVVTVKYTDIIWPDDISVNEATRSTARTPGKPLSESLLENRRKVAEALLDDCVWTDDLRGVCKCPGAAKHTNPDGLKDCEVFVDGVPSVHCLHTSCHMEVARANVMLRQATLSQEVVILPDGYATVEDASEQLYEILKSTKRFYLRGNTVSEVGFSTTGPGLEPVTPVRATATWEKFTRFGWRSFKDGEEKITLARLPEPEAKIFLVADERQRLPHVEGVVTCPILYKDILGTLRVHNDGYNPTTKLFVANPNAKVPVPTMPLAEAVEAIRDLVGDFLFESPAHRSRAIMSFITPALVFAGLLGGRPPVDVAEADDSQAGKGYRHKMLCAIYGETPAMVSQKKGGVGGLDESFQEALIRGRPFIVLENLRGKLDSPLIEGFLTAPDVFGARGFGKAEIEVRVGRFMVLASSNELNLTVDMANRSSIIRIRKQPSDFRFKQYGPHKVDVAEWVKQNQPYYLGCVYRIVQEWFDQGCQTIQGANHDFRWWAARGEWIIQRLFGERPMLDGHRSIQTRAGDARLGWLQRVAVQAEKSSRLDEWLKMHDIVSLCGEGGFEPYRKSSDYSRQFADDASELRYLGTIFGPLFQRSKNAIELDGFRIERGEVMSSRESNGQNFPVKAYAIRRTGSDLQPMDPLSTSTPAAPDSRSPRELMAEAATSAVSFLATESPATFENK